MSERPSYLEAMAELQSFLNQAQAPSDSLHRVARIAKRANELILLVPINMGAAGTNEFVLSFKASDRFVEILEAIRTLDWERLAVLEHDDLRRSEGKLE